ncbi:MAG TPA: hypothetical protein PLX65_06635, partial [Accumulibacter sp.]|nr:hypothetical protein [Accumulibacter sp.]
MWYPSEGRLCGVDEAGRGPLAGPVVAAAVILDPQQAVTGLDDFELIAFIAEVTGKTVIPR